MLQRSVEASSDERRRIAATLHDGVVQQLAAASFAVAGNEQAARSRGETDLAENLRSAGEAIRSSIGGMRSLLVDIYPPNLRTAGLVPALAELASAQREPPVVISLDERAAARLTTEQQEAVFRIVGECIRNAARHGHASSIQLSLTDRDGQVAVEVRDEGVGFDPARTATEGHFGLELMTTAALEIGAELAVTSSSATGTSWELCIPS
jgi:signal transduction histidine kinase